MDLNFEEEGKNDTERVREFATYAKNRKAVLKGTVPTEILAMILAPKHQAKRTPHIQAKDEEACRRQETMDVLFIPEATCGAQGASCLQPVGEL